MVSMCAFIFKTILQGINYMVFLIFSRRPPNHRHRHQYPTTTPPPTPNHTTYMDKNYIHHKMWYEIRYAFSNLNCATVDN